MELEQQLLAFQASLKEVDALQARAGQEIDLFHERENAWRAKIEEFASANKAWALSYEASERARSELETLLRNNVNGV